MGVSSTLVGQLFAVVHRFSPADEKRLRGSFLTDHRHRDPGPRPVKAVNRYRDLLTTPGVARLISAQLTARLPSGMISLAYLIHVERIFDSYGLAGLVPRRDKLRPSRRRTTDQSDGWADGECVR